MARSVEAANVDGEGFGELLSVRFVDLDVSEADAGAFEEVDRVGHCHAVEEAEADVVVVVLEPDDVSSGDFGYPVAGRSPFDAFGEVVAGGDDGVSDVFEELVGFRAVDL